MANKDNNRLIKKFRQHRDLNHSNQLCFVIATGKIKHKVKKRRDTANDETLYPGKYGFQEGFRDGIGQTR